MYQIGIKENSPISKVQQIVNSLAGDIEEGRLKKEYKLPSINQFSESNGVARDTVEKAYKQLRKLGYIKSSPGRGYFVSEKKKRQLKVLLISDKPASFSTTRKDNLLHELGGKDRVDLKVRTCTSRSLIEVVEKMVGDYDYYIISPELFKNSTASIQA